MDTAFEQRLANLVEPAIEEAIRIAEIAAPTFEEHERAAYVESRLGDIGGWAHLERDDAGNVAALLPGDPELGRVLVAAHLDTVFPEREISIERKPGVLSGPGIGDNSLSVAALLAVGEALSDSAPTGIGDILLCWNVGEEGRGDLGGIRTLCRRYQGRFDRVIAVEGLALDRVQTAAVGSLRYEVQVTARGGHSWSAYGRPNAIRLLAGAIAALEPLYPVPGSLPKATLNVGVIRGGRSVNTIAPEARCELDLRSDDPAALHELDRAAREVIERSVTEDGAELAIREIGRRPAGQIDRHDPLIEAVVAARGESGLGPADFNSGSTDANHALGLGIPATCVGVTTGGEAHTPREWIRTGPVVQGLPYVGRAVVAAARLSRLGD